MGLHRRGNWRWVQLVSLLALPSFAATMDSGLMPDFSTGASHLPKPGEGNRIEAFPRDASLIFRNAWMRLVSNLGNDETRVTFPQEIIWLNGAPGAGKTTNTAFISKKRSITAEPLVVSSLLTKPEMSQIKDQGFLVGDKYVTELLFEALMAEKYQAGVVVDGFPRTSTQATICRLLHDRLTSLHRVYKGTELTNRFARPIFRIVVLYVDEQTSVSRQLQRGKAMEAHNAHVAETGAGKLQEVRATDLDENLALRRYKTFNDYTYDALKSLGEHFIYNLINAGGPILRVQDSIEQEMQYQSTIELNPETFDVVGQLELASEVTMNARQRLVRRMDNYALRSPSQFASVARVLKEDIYPVIQKHAVSGRCSHVSHNKAFLEEEPLQMAIDILSERGFRVTSEPVVRGTKFDIAWQPPDNVGMSRVSARGPARGPFGNSAHSPTITGGIEDKSEL